MKITSRMAAIEEELDTLSYLSNGEETPRIKELIREYQEELKKVEAEESNT